MNKYIRKLKREENFTPVEWWIIYVVIGTIVGAIVIIAVCGFSLITTSVLDNKPEEISYKLVCQESNSGEKLNIIDCISVKDNTLTFTVKDKEAYVRKSIIYYGDVRYIPSDVNTISFTEEETCGVKSIKNVTVHYDSSRYYIK